MSLPLLLPVLTIWPPRDNFTHMPQLPLPSPMLPLQSLLLLQLCPMLLPLSKLCLMLLHPSITDMLDPSTSTPNWLPTQMALLSLLMSPLLLLPVLTILPPSSEESMPRLPQPSMVPAMLLDTLVSRPLPMAPLSLLMSQLLPLPALTTLLPLLLPTKNPG